MKKDQRMKRKAVMMNKKAALEEVGMKGADRKTEKQEVVMKDKALVSSSVSQLIVYHIILWPWITVNLHLKIFSGEVK